MLGMHMMLLNIFGLDRAEGAKPDMERDKTNLNTLAPDFVKQLWCEMQPCCRCSGTAKLTGVDCLITVCVSEILSYIVGERHIKD